MGRQGCAETTTDELALKMAAIHYEVVNAIAACVPRVAVSSSWTHRVLEERLSCGWLSL